MQIKEMFSTYVCEYVANWRIYYMSNFLSLAPSIPVLSEPFSGLPSFLTLYSAFQPPYTVSSLTLQRMASNEDLMWGEFVGSNVELILGVDVGTDMII